MGFPDAILRASLGALEGVMRGSIKGRARVQMSLLVGATMFALCASILAFVPRAHAGGFELAGAGTVPLGRGGAWTSPALSATQTCSSSNSCIVRTIIWFTSWPRPVVRTVRRSQAG